MNKEIHEKLHNELIDFFNSIGEDRVYFKIERDKKGKRYTISVTVYRRCGTYAEIPTSIFPKFNNVMHAYIYCVGVIHTAFSKENAYFTSEDDSIWRELCRLQSDDGEYGEVLAEKMMAAAMRQHSNRQKNESSKPED